MSRRWFATTLDPVDLDARTAAERLGARLDDGSEVGQVVRPSLAEVAAGERTVALRDTVSTLTEADPTDKADLDRELGVTLRYDPATPSRCRLNPVG